MYEQNEQQTIELLSNKTGYIHYLYEQLMDARERLDFVLEILKKYKPWFDSNEFRPIIPKSDNHNVRPIPAKTSNFLQ